jgi:hypothetical protein
MTATYTARHHTLHISPEIGDLVRRRTMPFLDNVGLTRPLNSLLAEAYLQGMKDAVAAMSSPPEASD